MNDTAEVLKWARKLSNETEIVKIFWDQLIQKLGLDSNATEREVLDKVCRYGGNTFVNLFRGEGVPYKEVAYDVAKTLKKPFETKEFEKNDLASIEKFILKKMDIQEENLEEICKLIVKSSDKNVRQNATVNAAQKAVLKGVGMAVGQQAAKVAAQKAAEKAAKKAAQKAAEEMGKQVAKQLLIRIMGALNVVFILWTVADIAGPAMRKTIPSVTYIALLRQLYKNYQSGLKEEFE